MNTIRRNFKMILPMLVFGLCLVFCPLTAVAEEENNSAIDISSGVPFTNDGTIMTVEPANARMVVFEKEVLVAAYKSGDKILNTTLLGTGGNSVELSYFKEGQRVRVVGFLMPDNRIVAQSVQQVSSSSQKKGKDRSALRELKPIQ